MKQHFFAFALGALVLGFLGSCTQQLDRLDREIETVKSDKIATVEEQIAAINGSIADLETIRQNIQSLIDADKPVGDSLARLREADAALKTRIDELKTYVDNSLKAYAKADWAEASFATLQQYEWTCDTIAQIDARLTGLDNKLTGLVESTVTSLKAWVNSQLGAYYTVAELDVKLSEFEKAIDSAGLSGNTKLVKIQEELADAKASLDSAKTNITNEYEAAIRSAIETNEGKLTKALSDSIASVNAEVAALGLRVGTLEQTVAELTSRADALEGMVQSLAIVPAYSDGSVDVKIGLLFADVAVTPASAVESLEAADFKLIVNAAGGLKEVEAASLSKDASNGTVTVTADIAACLSDDLTVAVKVVKGISSIATGFVPVYESMSGQGTEQSPYLVRTASALDYLHTALVAGDTTYVELAADIDLSSIENWEPFNTADPYNKIVSFDGKGHEISNMTTTNRTYTSFFGVLNGVVKNVTFENCKATSNTGYTVGIVAGYAGSGTAILAHAENVVCKDCLVESTYQFQNKTGGNSRLGVGGVFGTFQIGSAKNVTFDGTVNNKVSTTASGTDLRSATGGLCGELRNPATVVENITVKGEINSIGGKYTAGIVGYATDNGAKLVNCTNEANVTANNDRTGGICGHFQGGNIIGCVNKGEINSNGKNQVGGIVAVTSDISTITGCKNVGNLKGGQAVGGICANNEKALTVSRCSVAADITVTNSNAGGIVGYLNIAGSSVSECWYKGTMDVKDNAGGICGAISSTNVTTPITISNCYSKGTINNAANQKSGGIGGECCQYTVIENCYSTMEISGGGRVFGSIAGRFNNNQWNGGQTTDYHMEATNCIAAGSIVSTGTNTSWGSSGALLASCPAKVAHYTNCWRKYNFTFNVAYATEGVGLVDQGYTVTSFTAGTYLQSGYTTNSNWYPYHGSEASASALKAAYSGWTTDKADAELTVSDIAAAIHSSDAQAFASDIWDLTGDCPVLKNIPEE